MGFRDDYKFLQVMDAVASINQNVNLVGIVLETGIPKRSKGTDFFVMIKIIDQSKPSPGISVNFFAETMDALPKVLCCGDIIQLSRVSMKTQQSEVFALYNKKYSSFALFEGKCGTTYVPYQCSSKYNAREQDRKIIDDLRKWLVDHQKEMGSSDLLQLKDIKVGEGYNFICKILHLSDVQKDKWIVYVWDGTDTPAQTIVSRLEDEREKPLPLILEPIPLSRDIICRFPTVGTVFRIKIKRDNGRLGFNTVLKAGKWMKLLNLKCKVRSGIWVASVKPYSRICHLPDDDELVLQQQRMYDGRFTSKHGRMPQQCFPWPSNLTETDYPHVPCATLMDILCYPEVAYKYKCVARVVAVFPWRAEDFRSPKGIYRIRITVEDPTARLHAFLYDEDAVEFFGGYHSVDEMKKKKNKLLGIEESGVGRDPPWVQLCLKSYSVDADDIWGSRNYRVFATRFKE